MPQKLNPSKPAVSGLQHLPPPCSNPPPPMRALAPLVDGLNYVESARDGPKEVQNHSSLEMLQDDLEVRPRYTGVE